jgi:hypothetical protein
MKHTTKSNRNNVTEAKVTAGNGKAYTLSRLTPAQRKNYEAGLALVSKKLALAKLEKVKRLAQPRAYRIVKGDPQPHALEAVKPGPAPAPRRTGKPAVHVVFVALFE